MFPEPRFVLIADPDYTVRESIRSAFEARGRCVFEARNGHECFRVAKDIHPDVILIELGLPELAGCETTQALRLYEPTALTPIVGLAAAVSPHERERALHVGCDAVLTKPLDDNLLIAVVDELFIQRKMPLQSSDSGNPPTEMW